MTFADGAVILIIVIVITLASIKIISAKRKGAACVTCMGCPHSSQCSKAHDDEK